MCALELLEERAVANYQGRKPFDTPSRIARRLEAAGERKDAARAEWESANAALDVVMAAAFEEGVPIKPIAEHCGVTRKRVYEGLARLGLYDGFAH